jgi:branched-chain amino acid transport system ATP-binding protein
MGGVSEGSFEPGIVIGLGLVLCLGCVGAFATGRALAHTWRPVWRLIPYALLLAAASAFLCWALFGVPVIPASRLIARALAGDWGEALVSLSGLGMSFVLLLATGAAGFTLTRGRQMRSQYPFPGKAADRPEKL